MRTLGTLHALNLGNYPRRGVGVVRVPLPLEIDLAPGSSHRASIGAAGVGRLIADRVRRASGSARTGTLTFDAGDFQPGRATYSMNLLEEWSEVAALHRFQVHPWIAAAASAFSLSLTVDRREVPLAIVNAQTGPFLASTEFAGREDSLGFWARLHLLTPTRSPFQRFELWVGFNDDRLPDALSVDLFSGLALESSGVVPVFDFAENRGIAVQRQETGSYRAELGGRGLWGDSQAVLLTGKLVAIPPRIDGGAEWTNEEAALLARGELENLPLEYVAGGWHQARAFGPFGGAIVSPPHLIESQQKERALADLAARELRSLPRSAGLFLHGPHAAAERPGVSGDQRDFGLGQLFEVVDAERPDLLYPVTLSVQQEAVRPGHYREQNGEPVRAENHPGWATYQHVTHYHASYDLDRLGKRPGTYRFGTSHRGTVWKGHDPQHESINFLTARAVLRPDPWNLQLVHDWIETALAGYPIASGTYLDGLGGTRAVGRMTLAMIWAHLATGRADILERARQRLHVNYAERAFSAGSLREPTGPSQVLIRAARETDRTILAVDPRNAEMIEDGVELLRPTTSEEAAGLISSSLELASPLFVSVLFGPDPRSVPVPNWSPWQESFVAQGFAALWSLTGDPLAGDAAFQVARTVSLYGVRCLPDGAFDLGGYLAFENGEPLPDHAWDDPDRVKLYGSGVGRWILPAMDIAASFAARRQDPDRERLELRARLFRAWLHRDRDRHQTTPGGWDRLTPWEQLAAGVTR